MRGLPDDAAASVVRGFAAYIRDTPAQELPAALRSLAKFRTPALVARKEQMLDALEDEGMRALVVQWMDERRRSLSKSDARALRLFCERPRGWEKELRELAAVRPEPAPSRKRAPEEALERERVRTKRAKEDARRAREVGSRAVEAERARVAELRVRIGELETELGAARRDLKSARGGVESELRRLERELRKARREVERARAERDELKVRLRDERRRADALERTAAEAERRRQLGPVTPPATPPGPPAARPRRARPSRRTPLRVPPGRPGDDPETLAEWLEAPGVHLLIDGYNVTLAEGGFGGLELETQRARLVQEVARLVRRKGAEATVVFDGSEIAPGTARRHRSRYVRVEYSRPPRSADDHLVGVLQDLPTHPVIVVTNDRELQGRARRHGATIATSGQLLALIRG
jgi:predicted RNA-binding protein with PIN domain